MPAIGWTQEALDQHLREEARARRRIERDRRDYRADAPRGRRPRARDNRGALKNELRREVRA